MRLLLILIAVFSIGCSKNYAPPGPLAEGSFGKPEGAKQVKERVEMADFVDEGVVFIEIDTEVGTGAKYGLDKPGPLKRGTPHPFGNVKVRLAENTVASSVTCTLYKPEADVQHHWHVGLVCEFVSKNASGESRFSINDDGTVSGY